MDGTLLDSMEMWYNLGFIFLNKRNIPVPANLHKEVEHMRLSEAAEYFAKIFPLNMTGREVLDDWFSIVADEYDKTIALKPYVLDYLKKLKAEGVRMCVATLTDREHAIPALKRQNILDYFEFVLTVREVGKNKTYPDIFLQCAQRLGATASESTVFEDSFYAAKTAKDAGFQVCAIFDTFSKTDMKDLLE